MNLFAYKRRGRGWQCVERTLRSLLIGYDMIPLIGLQRMKQRLLAKGSIHKVKFEPSSQGKYFALFRDGKLMTEFLWFSGMPHQERWRAVKSSLLFLRDRHLPDEESNRQAIRLYFRPKHPTPRKIVLRQIKFLAHYGFTVERVALLEVKP